MTQTVKPRRGLRPAAILISLIAAFTAFSPFLADWNATHIFNPAWPPHAKFHNAQTMMFGVLCGAIALFFLWRRSTAPRHDLTTGTLFAGLYWAAQLPAILFPGTDFYDPEFSAGKPHLFGIEIVQAHLAALFLSIIAAAHVFERLALRIREQDPATPANADSHDP